MTSPYTPPTTSLSKDRIIEPHTDAYGNPLPQLLTAPRKCPAGWGKNWLIQAFDLLKQNFWLWIGMGLCFILISFIGGFIPYLGILVSFGSIILFAGLIKGAADQAEGRDLKFEHLFVGFQTHFVPLLVLVLLYMVGCIIIMIPAVMILSGIFFALLDGDGFTAMAAMLGQEGDINSSIIMIIVLVVLVAMLFFIPLMMCMWFAPTLIILQDISPIESMKMSFKGCMKNFLPFLIFSLFAMVVFIVLTIFTIGLGILLIYPLMFIVYYTSYRDVWTDQPLSSM